MTTSVYWSDKNMRAPMAADTIITHYGYDHEKTYRFRYRNYPNFDFDIDKCGETRVIERSPRALDALATVHRYVINNRINNMKPILKKTTLTYY